MSKYKAGDKAVMEITDRFKNAYGHEYYSILDSIYSTDFIDEKTEPLSTHTEPLERKNENKQKRIEKLVDRLHNQAAEITRLLAENKRLKAENGNSLWNIEQARADGAEAAWKFAHKVFGTVRENIYSVNDLMEIFGNDYDFYKIAEMPYPEAAAKVEAWEKAKPLRTIFDDFLEKYPNALVNDEGVPYTCPYTLGYGEKIKDCMKKMNCFDCWNRTLEQIGEE